jgi:flagellar biogenesis protein FliO
MPLAFRVCLGMGVAWLLACGPALLSAQHERAPGGESVAYSQQVMEVGRSPAAPADSATARQPAGRELSRPLPPRGTATKLSSASSDRPAGGFNISTMLGSLAVVIGLFLLVVWFARRAAPQAVAPLPTEVVQVLGRTSLAQRNMLQLVRVGSKLILVAVTPQGATTLTEIADPAEVDRLSTACERQRPGSISASFRQVLGHFAREPNGGGFIADESVDQPVRMARAVSD